MGRPLRASHPGIAFHLTARAQAREPLLAGLEGRAIEMILRWAAERSTSVLAYAIMRNHLHIVAVPCSGTLGDYMHPLLSEIALMINRERAREGHVFERRYYSRPCFDAEYVRTAIAYVHLNPVRAEICPDASGYAWTSHAYYASAEAPTPTAAFQLSAATARQLFGITDCEPQSCSAGYQAFLKWRLAADALRAADPKQLVALPPSPTFRAGDGFWRTGWTQAFTAAPLGEGTVGRTQPELPAIVAAAVDAMAPGLDLDTLRGRTRTKQVVEVRRCVIRNAFAAGYANHQIAKYLNLSTSLVSLVAAELRSN